MPSVLLIAQELTEDGPSQILDIYQLETEMHDREAFKFWYSRIRREMRQTHGYNCFITIKLKDRDAVSLVGPAYFARRMYENLKAKEAQYERELETLRTELSWYLADQKWERHWDAEAEMKRATASESTVPIL